MVEMIGMCLGEEDEVKPRNQARIDCANSHNTRSRKKITEDGWDFCCTLDFVWWMLRSQSSIIEAEGLQEIFEEPQSGETIRTGGLPTFCGICLFPRFVSPCSPPATAFHRCIGTSSSLCLHIAIFLGRRNQAAQVFATDHKNRRYFGKQTDVKA